jgi:hypothetical protein
MLPFNDGKHTVYGPDTLQVMGAAFDGAVQLLPGHFKENERARKRLALLLLQHMDRGEPARNLVTLAVLDFLRATQ